MSEVREQRESANQPPSSNAGMGMDVSRSSFWTWWFKGSHWLDGYRREWRFLILVWAFLGVVGLAIWNYGVERLPDGTADISMAVAAVVSVLGTLVPNLTNPGKYTWLLSRRGVGVMGLLTLFSGVAVAGSYGASIRTEADAARRARGFAKVEQERDEARREMATLLSLVGPEDNETSVLGRLVAVHALLGDRSEDGVLARLHKLDTRLPSAQQLAANLLGPESNLLPAIKDAAQRANPKVSSASLAEALQDETTKAAMLAIVNAANPKVSPAALAEALQDETTKRALRASIGEVKPEPTTASLIAALQSEEVKKTLSESLSCK